MKANVADESDIQNLIDTTVKTYGTVDILVNNAGIMDNFEPAGDIEDDSWNRIFAVNTTSVMRATRKVLPIFLAKQQGVIINVASAGGLWCPGRCSLHSLQACGCRIHQEYRIHVCSSGHPLQCDCSGRGGDQYRIYHDAY